METLEHAAATIPPCRELLYREDLARIVGRNPKTIDRWERLRLIPAAVSISGRPAWLKRDIDAWLALRCPDRRRFETIRRAMESRPRVRRGGRTAEVAVCVPAEVRGA